MIPQVIIIGRKKYAVGLFWQPIATGFAPRNYARGLSHSVDKKLNVFIEYRSLVGLGTSKLGHKTGMFSAAAGVMESFAEYSSFLAAFKVGSGFWLVSARNGIILQDKLTEGIADARDEFMAFHNMPDWGALFAPSDWEIPRAVQKNLNEIITGSVKSQLKPISRIQSALLSVIIVLISFFIIMSFFKGPINQMLKPAAQISDMNPELAAEYKKRLDAKKQELDEKYNTVKPSTDFVQPIALPYDILPDPGARAALCFQAIGFVMQPIIGWTQTTALCDGAQARATFQRKFGNLGQFYEIAGDIMPGVFVLEKSESQIEITAALPELKVFSSLEEKDVDTIVREVNTIFQKINTDVDIKIDTDLFNDGTQDAQVSVIEIGADSKLSPPEFIRIFDGFSGVYMTAVKWDAALRNWNYEVIIYAK